MTLLSAQGVSRTYRSSSLGGARKPRPVLDAVSIEIAAGETIALLGRSGCGKSTLARLLVGLEKPDAGQVLFEGRPLATFRRADWLNLRRTVQMVFQDPVGAVDSRATVEDIVSEPLRHLSNLSVEEAKAHVRDLLLSVGLEPGDAHKYPQQLSGGQLQRVCIARALAPGPKLIILDEAVSNLDLHLQIQMLDLFSQLRRDRNVAYLFVTHDLRLVERFCSKVAVMEQGRLVEQTPIRSALMLSSREGRALQEAVLPAMPRRRQ